jgi:hypothetical protein
MCALLLTAAIARAQDSAAQAAAERYAAGDYAGAAALYEALIQAGVRDGAVFYNLGSAYLQAGDQGRAMLNYRRAQALMPRAADVNARLAAVRAQRVDLLGDETAFVDSLATVTASVLTDGELMWLLWGLWALTWAALAVLLRGGQRRTTVRAVFGAALVALAFVGALAANRAYVSSSRPAAVVIAPTAAVYSGPGEAYLEIYQMHAAAEIRLLETQGEWVRFVRPDEQQGWIRQAEVTRVE